MYAQPCMGTAARCVILAADRIMPALVLQQYDTCEDAQSRCRQRLQGALWSRQRVVAQGLSEIMQQKRPMAAW